MARKPKLPRTLQEIFDKSVEGLASQGFRQAMDGDSCMYRSPDGLKCAAGWLISDDEYETVVEGLAANTVFALTDFSRRATHVNDLQQCHDYGKSPELMRSLLRRFARNHRLKLPASLA